MRIFFTLAAIAGVVLGARHFVNALTEQRKNRALPQRLDTWEGEGGALPARPRRTDQQVSPRRVSKASPRGVR